MMDLMRNINDEPIIPTRLDQLNDRISERTRQSDLKRTRAQSDLRITGPDQKTSKRLFAETERTATLNAA
ncbi:hypothetical protein JOB18_002462 [Solea senegalensis]|uniref:Uncharacterized protein n=1 Tax=Solea senegalensis TaxID=28829 RepID=A0AAV6RIM7_SOLSE|nr:hypothetical protein JOB18_002462 [Solea senegalensis]